MVDLIIENEIHKLIKGDAIRYYANKSTFIEINRKSVRVFNILFTISNKAFLCMQLWCWFLWNSE